MKKNDCTIYKFFLSKGKFVYLAYIFIYISIYIYIYIFVYIQIFCASKLYPTKEIWNDHHLLLLYECMLYFSLYPEYWGKRIICWFVNLASLFQRVRPFPRRLTNVCLITIAWLKVEKYNKTIQKKIIIINLNCMLSDTFCFHFL